MSVSSLTTPVISAPINPTKTRETGKPREVLDRLSTKEGISFRRNINKHPCQMPSNVVKRGKVKSNFSIETLHEQLFSTTSRLKRFFGSGLKKTEVDEAIFDFLKDLDVTEVLSENDSQKFIKCIHKTTAGFRKNPAAIEILESKRSNIGMSIGDFYTLIQDESNLHSTTIESCVAPRNRVSTYYMIE